MTPAVLADSPNTRRIYTVGLTGGIGSGKSAVTQIFEELGVTVVDTDVIAHALTGSNGEAMPAIEAAFGTEVVSPDGSLNRSSMRSKVFQEPDVRRRLEGILHPMIREESQRQLALAASSYAILAVPLLIESGDYRSRCHRILVVDCPESTQIERVMARSKLTRDEVQRIISAQGPTQSAPGGGRRRDRQFRYDRRITQTNFDTSSCISRQSQAGSGFARAMIATSISRQPRPRR